MSKNIIQLISLCFSIFLAFGIFYNFMNVKISLIIDNQNKMQKNIALNNNNISWEIKLIKQKDKEQDEKINEILSIIKEK